MSENGEEKEHYYTDKGFSEESVEIWLSSIEKGGERFHGSRLRDQRGVGCFLWQGGARAQCVPDIASHSAAVMRGFAMWAGPELAGAPHKIPVVTHPFDARIHRISRHPSGYFDVREGKLMNPNHLKHLD